MKKFIISCTWEMVGEFIVEANSLEEAIIKVEESEKPFNGLPNDSEYVDDSFTVDRETSYEKVEDLDDEDRKDLEDARAALREHQESGEPAISWDEIKKGMENE